MLEEALDTLDAQLSERSATDYDNGCMRNEAPERKTILEALHKTIKEYGIEQQYTQHFFRMLIMLR